MYPTLGVSLAKEEYVHRKWKVKRGYIGFHFRFIYIPVIKKGLPNKLNHKATFLCLTLQSWK